MPILSKEDNEEKPTLSKEDKKIPKRRMINLKRSLLNQWSNEGND